jgi:N-acetylglucosamine kinase-like BadF-type ATPase
MFAEETGVDVAKVVQMVYRDGAPNKFLASLSRFCVNHIDEEAIQIFLIDCFEQYFRRNILHYENPSGMVHLVGSIAEVYQDQVIEAAANCNLKVGRILHSPIEGLAEIIN